MIEERKGKITFCAYRPLTQQAITLRPCEDASGRLYTGQGEQGYLELLSEEEKRKLKIVINHDTSFIISHDKVLDLDNEIDRAHWGWIKKHPWISEDREEGVTKYKDKLFYVANPVKEAKLRVNSSKFIDEARYSVRKLSYDDMCFVAKGMGNLHPNALNQEQLLDYLLNSASTAAGAIMILEVMNPENKSRVNAGVFFDKAIAHQVISRERNGGFYMNGPDGFLLGYTKEEVTEFLLSKDNLDTAKILKTMVEDKSKETVE